MADRNQAHQQDQSKTPTEPPQPASLGTLPREIIAAIIRNVFPNKIHIPATYVGDVPYPQYSRKCQYERGKVIAFKNSKTEHQLKMNPPQCFPFAVLHLNQRFYAQTRRMLYDRTFRISIGECAFYFRDAAEMAYSAQHSVDWTWIDVFPGLDLSQVLELVIEIAPTDYRGFWYNVKNALENLCQTELLPRGPIMKLKIELKDMRVSRHWKDSKDRRSLSCFTKYQPADARISARFEDYDAVLEPLKEAMKQAGHSEIILPYWMECRGMKERIVERWGSNRTSVALDVNHTPSGRFQQNGCRHMFDLARLPKEYLGEMA